MYQKLMHNKSLRLIGGLLGGLLLSVAINVFIVPQGLYGGGAYGRWLSAQKAIRAAKAEAEQDAGYYTTPQRTWRGARELAD